MVRFEGHPTFVVGPGDNKMVVSHHGHDEVNHDGDDCGGRPFHACC